MRRCAPQRSECETTTLQPAEVHGPGSRESNVHRGEVWWIDFGAHTIGSEMQKERPGVIVSDDSIGVLDVRVAVPITSWQPKFEGVPWMVRIRQTAENGLDWTGAADVLQIKCCSTKRLLRKLGQLDADDMVEIALAIGFMVRYPTRR